METTDWLLEENRHKGLGNELSFGGPVLRTFRWLQPPPITSHFLPLFSLHQSLLNNFLFLFVLWGLYSSSWICRPLKISKQTDKGQPLKCGPVWSRAPATMPRVTNTTTNVTRLQAQHRPPTCGLDRHPSFTLARQLPHIHAGGESARSVACHRIYSEKAQSQRHLRSSAIRRKCYGSFLPENEGNPHTKT